MNPALKAVILSAGAPSIDLQFTSDTVDSRVTVSGGANGTRMNASGVIESKTAPRIDYDPVTHGVKGVLVEEQRSNLLTASANMATWTKVASTATSGAAALDGTTAANTYQPVAGSGNHQAFLASAVSALAYTNSVYAKAGTTPWLGLAFITSAAADGAYFNLSTGAVGTVAASTTAGSVIAAGGSWYRCPITRTLAAGTGYSLVEPHTADAQSLLWTAAGTESLTLWGAQLEAGSFATSYIPTTSAAVTRTADSVVVSGSGFSGAWSPAQGAVAVTFDVSATSGTRPIVSFDDGTANNQIRLYASGASLMLTVTTGGVQQANLTLGTISAGTQYKAAFSYMNGGFNAALTGGILQVATSGAVPAVTQMRIGSDQAGNYQNGRTARVRFWRNPRSLFSLV